MDNRKILPIKEYRFDKLVKCLECIDKNAFNREKQRDCVLDLYQNRKGKDIEHRDKSIFRGMVISSLRYLGLIMGYSDFIRASANGKLLICSKLIDLELHNRVSRALVYELDRSTFKFITIIKKCAKLSIEELNRIVSESIDAPSEKQRQERIKKWFSILAQVDLINYSLRVISVNVKNLFQSEADVSLDNKDLDMFTKCLYDTYFELCKDSAGVVDIADLRGKVSLREIRENKLIITEELFDEMLRRISFNTEGNVISLGKPMGVGEKLFKYKDNYYKTIFIKTRGKEVGDGSEI